MLKKIALSFGSFVLFFAVGFAGKSILIHMFHKTTVSKATGSQPSTATNKNKKSTKRVPGYTVLAIGEQVRPGQVRANADTIMVIHVDKKDHRIALMSVPRDTRVDIPNLGVVKLNEAMLVGGPRLVRQTVNHLLGLHIRQYVVLNSTGFQNIVNTLGGVTLRIPQRMYYKGKYHTINLQAGVQHLNGAAALEFVRYREFPLGDIQRTLDQQAFLKALLKQTLQIGTLFKLPTLMQEVHQSLTTNMSIASLIGVASDVRSIGSKHMVTETLPGAFLNLPGESFWEVIPSDARLAYQNLLKGKKEPLMDKRAQAEAKALGGQANA